MVNDTVSIEKVVESPLMSNQLPWKRQEITNTTKKSTFEVKRLKMIRGGEKFAQFEFVFEFANIRRIRILKMKGKFAEFEFEFQHRNSLWRIRIRIESCLQNSRIFAENSNSHYDRA
jgi:hypothetical protein